MIDAIENYVIIALKTVSALDDVGVFIKGGLPGNIAVPQDLYPFAEVFCGQALESGELTGGMYEDEYTGLITFSVLVTEQPLADWAEAVESRTITLPSYTAVRELVTATVVELRKAEHRDLGGLTARSGNEVVTRMWLTEPVFGLDVDERTNNWENYGSIPFVVRTQGVY